jgi:hypothetical protein
MKLLAKQRALILLVARRAGIGVPAEFVQDSSFGA